jgi:hypothetical protein
MKEKEFCWSLGLLKIEVHNAHYLKTCCFSMALYTCPLQLQHFDASHHPPAKAKQKAGVNFHLRL